MSDAITRFLRTSRANRILLQCADDGQFEASAHRIGLQLARAEAPSRSSALVALDALIESIYPEPTIPTNEIPDLPPETLRPSEVANV